jgi:DNA-binding NtrC family response regulator
MSTGESLTAMIEQGRFRQELYHRISVIMLTPPPLRHRGTDIELLAESFRARYAQEFRQGVTGFTRDALDILQRHDWPGNVRELRNVIAVALAFGKEGPLDLAQHLAPNVQASEATPTRGRTFQDAKRDILSRFEREYFTALFAECTGNVSEIGRRAAMERAHVRGYLRRHGIGDSPKSGATKDKDLP